MRADNAYADICFSVKYRLASAGDAAAARVLPLLFGTRLPHPAARSKLYKKGKTVKKTWGIIAAC